MTYWPTFGQMRHDGQRTWFRMSDLQAAAELRGVHMTRYRVRSIIAHLPKPSVKQYGHWHYDERHRQAVIEAALAEAAGNPSAIPNGSTTLAAT